MIRLECHPVGLRLSAVRGSRVRVLYIIDSLVPGGAESSLAVMAGLYPARGIDLEVAYLHDRPGLQEVMAAAGARVTSLAGAGRRRGWARRAVALVRARRPDLVHTTLFEADITGRLAAASSRVPVVSSLVSVHYGGAEPGIRPWKQLGAQVADVATARLVRRFHAVSGHVADVMARRLLVSRSRVDVVPRGRDPKVLGSRTPERTARARELLGASSDDRLLVAVARHEYPKGLDVLLRALPRVRAEIPEVRLVVAGREGNHTAALRALVAELGIEDAVMLLGSRKDVAELLCAADLFVLPSRREGFPGAVLEAMALGAPIVATAIAGVSEAVADGEHAMLVPPEDPEALASSIVGALRSPEESRERAVAALGRFHDHFTVDRVADGMKRFYEAALSS